MSDIIEMKPSYHNSCNEGDADHNDRAFENEKSDEIVMTRVNKTYWEKVSVKHFLEIEFACYSDVCKDRLDEINANYIKQRKSSKCKSMADYYKSNPPLETVMQLGNCENGGVSADVMKDILERYRSKEKQFYKKHNIKCIFLDSAIHGADATKNVSEATTHVHERKLILYKTKSGTWEPNITKAYEQAGFQRPDMSKKSSRYNNVRMTVDNELRNLWLEACREIVNEQQLNISVLDYEHHPEIKHKNKKKYVYDKIREEQERREALDEREKSIELQRSELENERSELQSDKNTFMQEKADFEAEKQSFKDDVYKRAKAHFKNKYEKEFQILQDQLEQQNAIRLEEAINDIKEQYSSDFIMWQEKRNSRMAENALESLNFSEHVAIKPENSHNISR